MIKDISCVILSGGKSSRMGRDKALLPFGGYDSLAQYQYQKMKKIFENVYISSKSNKFDFECNLILDIHQTHSPMHALSSIFNKLGNKDIFLLAVDMPSIDIEIIKPLLNEYHTNSSEIICYKHKNIEPFCAIYRYKVKDKIEQMIEEQDFKLQNLLQKASISVLTTHKIDKFQNLNHYSDYLKSIL